MDNKLELETRIQQLEDKNEITDLVMMYGVIMDERDFTGMERLFTKDANLSSEDGVFSAHGLDAIKSTYVGRFQVLGATNHVTHGNVVRFDNEDPNQAIGLVTSHAEVSREGTALVAAIRYRDKYRRTDRGWQISDREMSFMYYVSIDDFKEALVQDDRVRVYGDRRPADWPECLKTGTSPLWIKDFLRY